MNPTQHSKISPNVQTATLVCVGQSGAMYWVTQFHCIQLTAVCTERHCNVAQRFALRQLRERHDTELLYTTRSTHARLIGVIINNLRKTCPRKEFNYLAKQSLASNHVPFPKLENLKSNTKIPFLSSK
jgi:hypothetical protein